jgi:hypothetical protein
VRDIAKTATSGPNQVTKEIAEFTNDAAIGFIDADQGCAKFSHIFSNRKKLVNLPINSLF